MLTDSKDATAYWISYQHFNIGFGTILSLLRSIGFIAEAEKLLTPLPVLPTQIAKAKEKKERVRHDR